MKNVGDKDDSKSRQNWDELSLKPSRKHAQNDSCRLLCILSAENIDRDCVTIYHRSSHVDHMFIYIVVAHSIGLTWKPLIELAVVRLKELNADKEVCEEVVQQSEIAALSMQVNSQAPPSSDVSVHLMIPSLSAPLSKLTPFPKLAHHQGSLLHTSQGPRVTVRVFRKDDEGNGSRGSGGS